MKKIKIITTTIIAVCLSSTLVFAVSQKSYNQKLNDMTTAKALNSTYKIEGESIKLTDGKSVMEIVPGAASKLVTNVVDKPVVGHLNGDKTKDVALIITQDAGGSGTFYYVAAMTTKTGKYSGTNAILLGDRIKIDNVNIKNGKIIVNYLDRKKNQAMVEIPSVKITKTFKIKDGTLQEVK